MDKPKARKQLNVLQKDILFVLYKFRFATRELIVEYQGLKSKTYTHYRLRGLLDQGYIGRQLSPEDRINRRAASYFILPGGIRTLRQEPGLNQKLLSTMYKDRLAGRRFIDRCLSIFSLWIKFNKLYPRNLNFYTKSELSEYDYFPRPLPDAYLTTAKCHFMLELISDESVPAFVPKRQIKRYIDHCEEDDWSELGESYPTLLLVCSTAGHERRVQKTAANLLNSADIDELAIYTSTSKALLGSQTKLDAVWSDVLEPEELLSLNQVSANGSA